MSTNLPPREAMQRLAEIAAQYREAFVQVQDELERTDLGRVPAWVFAIDRLPLDEIREVSPALGEAEERRRAWRTALQSLVEHLALDDGGESAEAAAEPQGDRAHLRKLDRFITVVNFAKAGGCIYIDGRFEPVTTRGGVVAGAGRDDDDGPPIPHRAATTGDIPPSRASQLPHGATNLSESTLVSRALPKG